VSFVFPKGAREFFEAVSKQREGPTKFIMFDQYYCCLMAGLDLRRIGDDADVEGEVFLNAYPEDYRGQADIIAGLLIDAELDRRGIAQEDRTSIEREIVRLLNPTSATRLSEEGNKLLNLYAAAGFKLIQARIMRPSGLAEFIVAYHDYWLQTEARPA
jgi:hypothetical protein